MNEQLLVIGATGAMGREVVRACLSDENNDGAIRMLTRNPRGRRAQALVEAGRGRVTAIKGDLDDTASLQRAMSGVQRVFLNTDFFSSLSVKTEYEQGVRALEAAREAGVEHVIYSSLDAAASLSGGLVAPRSPVRCECSVGCLRVASTMRELPQESSTATMRNTG